MYNSHIRSDNAILSTANTQALANTMFQYNICAIEMKGENLDEFYQN